MPVGKNYGVKSCMIFFTSIDGEVKKILRLAREVGGDGFSDMIDEEVEEHIEEHREVLTNEELEELVNTSTDDEDEDEEETRSVSDCTEFKGKNNGLRSYDGTQH